LRLAYKLRFATAKIGLNLLRISGFYRGYWQHWRGEIFDYAETKGLHVLPVHYYSPVPAQSDLSRKLRRNSMVGIDFDVPAGLAKAHFLLEKYRDKIGTLLQGQSGYKPTNAGFSPLDAAILYATVSETRPKRIVEIGSGMSTFVITAALRDSNLQTNFTCIEPFLPPYLRGEQNNISEIIEMPLQDVGIEKFKELDSGDILFIDSTHVVRYNSDVVYEILHILPILKPGVIIHVHDIFFPDDYPEFWLKQNRFFWNEQYMLQAFLSMNPNFKIEIPVHAIQRSFVTDLAFQSTTESVSLWIRRT
jgi:predicted O-methyltransferase YrrM